MKILLMRGKAGYGGAEGRFIRMQREFIARGIPTHLHWFEGGPLLDDIPADQPTTVGSLADAAELVADGGYDTLMCFCDDFPHGAGGLHRLGGARLFANAGGRSDFTWPSSRCAAIIAVSDDLRSRELSRTDAHVFRVHSGCAAERFGPGVPSAVPRQPVVAWVGRAREMQAKRIDRLAAAAPGLTAQGFEIWVISPSGPDLLPPELAASLLPHVTRWEGLAIDAMPEMYRAVAASGGCLLHTADFEGLSNVLLEAQACGCPVIGTDTPGTNEAIRADRGGVLFPPDLPGDDLAELVGSVLRDPRGTAWRGEAARAMVVEEFSTAAMIDGYLRVYQGAPYPYRWDPAAWRARLRARWHLRGAASWSRGQQTQAATVYLAAADELTQRGRGDLAAHLRERAREVAPWHAA